MLKIYVPAEIGLACATVRYEQERWTGGYELDWLLRDLAKIE